MTRFSRTLAVAALALAGFAAPAGADPVSEITLYDQPQQNDGFNRSAAARAPRGLDVSTTGSLTAAYGGLSPAESITLYDQPQQNDGFQLRR